VDKIAPGPQLDALTAEKVFGWKNIHKHAGSLVGKKQDKAGHWRLTKVPYYSTNPVLAYSIEDRMKQVGRLDRYLKELSRIARAKNIPSDWASLDQDRAVNYVYKLLTKVYNSKNPLFRGLAALRILLAGDDVNRTPINAAEIGINNSGQFSNLP